MPWHVGRGVLESKAAAWTVVVLLLASFALNVVVPLQARTYLHCIGHWADQYTARAERITKVNVATSTATGAYIHALNVVLADAIRQDQVAVNRDLPAYQKAATDYEAAAKTSRDAAATDPIPDAPKFQCR